MSLQKTSKKVLGYIIASVLFVVFVFPFYFTVIGSFNESSNIVTMNFNLLPDPKVFLDNYVDLFRRVTYARSVINTFIVAASVTAMNLFFCSLVGFFFGKHRFPGRDILFSLVLVTMMVPQQITLIPRFMIIRKLGWIDTYYALVTPGMITAFGVFLLRQGARGIPDELLDAARIDGCSEFRICFSIGVPLLKPILLVLAMIMFMQAWNSFLWPLVVLNDSKMFLITLILYSLQTRGVWMSYGTLLAGCTLGSLPLIILFMVLQKYFVRGILSGALKM